MELRNSFLSKWLSQTGLIPMLILSVLISLSGCSGQQTTDGSNEGEEALSEEIASLEKSASTDEAPPSSEPTTEPTSEAITETRAEKSSEPAPELEPVAEVATAVVDSGTDTTTTNTTPEDSTPESVDASPVVAQAKSKPKRIAKRADPISPKRVVRRVEPVRNTAQTPDSPQAEVVAAASTPVVMETPMQAATTPAQPAVQAAAEQTPFQTINPPAEQKPTPYLLYGGITLAIALGATWFIKKRKSI
jgi:hypothetical protein